MTDTATADWTVHRAGPMTAAGAQFCSGCHATLVDYGDARPTSRDPFEFGWRRGTLVAQLLGDATVSIGVLTVGEDMAPCGGRR